MKKPILVIGLTVLCFTNYAQQTKQKTDIAGEKLLFCQNLLSSERLLLLALQHGDYTKQRLFLSEASLAASNASQILLRNKTAFKKSLAQKELDDLEVICGYLGKESNKEDFTPSEPMAIALWCRMTDNKLEVILPKVLK